MALTPYPDILTPYPDILTSYPDIFTPYPDIFTPNPDINAHVIKFFRPRDLICFSVVNKQAYKLVHASPIYAELLRLKFDKHTYQFDTHAIIKYYYKYNMINLIQQHGLDHYHAVVIATEYGHLDLLQFLHPTSKINQTKFPYATYSWQNFKLMERVVYLASAKGHYHILKWFAHIGIIDHWLMPSKIYHKPIHSSQQERILVDAITDVSTTGNLTLLQDLDTANADWEPHHWCRILRIASEHGQLFILQYLSDQILPKLHQKNRRRLSACGKTNLSMLIPTIPGWKVETVGEDIAWMKIGDDGRLYAINPEYGFFGVAPGTSMKSNPNAMGMLHENAVYTNCAETLDGDVWWEGMTDQTPPKLIDWLRRPWTPNSGRKAAHPNARFTVAAKQCPVIAPEWEDPKGVPIDAILFGGRRAGIVPLVTEAFSWQHGTFLGSTLSSETTAAIAGKVGQLRRDPMAMLAFCGYHMGDYFGHWLKMGTLTETSKLPKIFYVNWFRQDQNHKFLWPGFGENSRVLKWIFERCDGKVHAKETAIGRLPEIADLDTNGLDMSRDKLEQLLSVNVDQWLAEVPSIREHFAHFGSHLPEGLNAELKALEERLKAAKK